MEIIASFFIMMLTAVAMENAVFARALGIGKQSLFLKSPMEGILFGGLLTGVATAASIPVAACNILLRDVDTFYLAFIRAPIYLVCVCGVYLLVHFSIRRYRPVWYEVIRPVLPVATFNSALFGALFVTYNRSLGFFDTVGYTFGVGLGYTAALLIIYYARKRLAISPVPRSFRGLPILLVYIGLLSLAIYGLIGHNLPT